MIARKNDFAFFFISSPIHLHLPWKSRQNWFLLNFSFYFCFLLGVYLIGQVLCIYCPTGYLGTEAGQCDHSRPGSVWLPSEQQQQPHQDVNTAHCKRWIFLRIYQMWSATTLLYRVFTSTFSSSQVYSTWWFRAYLEQSVLWSWLKFRDMLSGTNMWNSKGTLKIINSYEYL